MRTSFGVLRVKFPLIIWRITVLKRLRLLSNLVGFAFFVSQTLKLPLALEAVAPCNIPCCSSIAKKLFLDEL